MNTLNGLDEHLKPLFYRCHSHYSTNTCGRLAYVRVAAPIPGPFRFLRSPPFTDARIIVQRLVVVEGELVDYMS